MKTVNIYLADDDKEDRELFIDALSEIPFDTEVKQFDNGVDLMDELFAKQFLPDIIFLDLRMPLMDGFECLSDIRSFEQFSAIQVIVYSSSYHQREVDQLKNEGANQYLQKPTSFNQLKTLLYQSIKPFVDGNENRNSTNDFVILA